MRFARLLLAVALPVFAAACGGGLDVNTDWDPSVDFSAYQSFFVLEDAASGGVALDRLTQNRITSAMATALSGKGMQQVNDTASADVAIGWMVTTEDRTSFQTVSTGWGGYGWGGYGGWYGGGMSMGTSNTTQTNYTVGTLLLALFDVEQEKMVFTGQGSQTLSDDNLTPQESQQRANDIVARILRDFPPDNSGS